MNQVKYRIEPFQIYDYQGVEQHLARMAAKGWRLEKIGRCFWKYRRTEPAQVRYAVTYGQDISQFDPAPTEAQQSLEELCTSAGWKKTAEWSQMLIFSTEDPNPVPLETDGAILLDIIHRTMKGSFFGPALFLLAVVLFILASSVNTLIRTPLRFFDSNARLFSFSMYLLLAVLLLVYLGTYFTWRRRSLRSTAQGGPCVPLGRGYIWVEKTGVALMLILLAAFILMELLNANASYVTFFLLYLLLMNVLIFAVHGTNNLLKKRGASKGTNMAVTLTVDVVLAVVMMAVFTFGVFRWLNHSSAKETYATADGLWDVQPREDLLLTVSDLTGLSYDHIRRTAGHSGSIFLPQQTGWDVCRREGDAQIQDISYQIWEPKTSWLYRVLLEDVTAQKEDPASWGADAVYRRYLDGEPQNAWVLAWPGRIVQVYGSWTFTSSQKALSGKTLAP